MGLSDEDSTVLQLAGGQTITQSLNSAMQQKTMKRPVSTKDINASLFCVPCRALLSSATPEGFAILDLYDLASIKAYAVKDGASFTIRDYDVAVSREQGEYIIQVTGHLY